MYAGIIKVKRVIESSSSGGATGLDSDLPLITSNVLSLVRDNLSILGK